MLTNLTNDAAAVSSATGIRRRSGEIIGERGLLGRRVLKRFMYSQLALRSAVMIALGLEQPHVKFKVEADPPSIYLVFAIRSDAVETLPERLGLPTELELHPIRCMPDDAPTHYLTCNVYRVTGITNALRAEWSLYVHDRELPDTPRYLVVDARSSTPSLDGVDLLTPAMTVEHDLDGRVITTLLGDAPETLRSTITLPNGVDASDSVRTAQEWVSANDLIYWRNGIRDRTFYDAGMAAPKLWHLDGADEAVNVSDDSPWSAFCEPTPRHVLVHGEQIEFVIQPWENVDQIQP